MEKKQVGIIFSTKRTQTQELYNSFKFIQLPYLINLPSKELEEKQA